MEIDLQYGKGTVTVEIPDSVDVTVLEPKKLSPVDSVELSLRAAIEQAVSNNPTIIPSEDAGKSIAIVVPDDSRSLPVSKILPVVLQWLAEKIPDLQVENINIVVGCGLHARNDIQAIKHLIPGNLPQGCKITIHDAFKSPTIKFGTTRKGTPVLINETFASADYKIVIGQIDPHQIVGFTDSIAGLVTGCSGEATLEHNHSLMFHPAAKVGVIEGNPVREDLNEAGQIVGIDLAIDFVLAPTKEIVKVIAGVPGETLFEGAPTSAELYGVGIDKKFDIIIASCGGFPKDISIYQAQKGLNLASQALQLGGHILLLAALSRGVGDDIYFDYVSQFTTPEEVIADFRKQEFKMGAHKAYLLGRTLNEFDVAVHSEMEQGVLQKCHLRAAKPTSIIAEWLEDAADKKIGIITSANTTYFHEKKI